MTSNTDWIPSSEDSLIKLMAVWSTKLSNSATQTAYGWVATECTATVATITAFNTAYTAYHTTPTPPNRLAKDEAKKTAIAAMRKFAAERIRNNSKMTPPQRLELGIPIHDAEPTPVPVPAIGPAARAEITSAVPGRVRVHYLGSKPYGVDRIEIAWLLSETPIDNPHLLPNKETFSRNPWEHDFSDDRGKKMYYALRYLTKEGDSPWSVVQEVIVP
jgi:hypothetical protein